MKMHTKLLGSAALSAMLIAGMTGCGDDTTTNNTYITDTCEEVGETISPYQRVAVISGTWADVPGIADKIAQYVTLTDEDDTIANGGLGFESGGWIIGGAKTPNNGGTEVYEFADLLPIPANGIVNSPGKSRVIEFCNGMYAGMAMATGLRHGPALPCEVSVHSDGTNIYIDMLDADAIFSIFFQDISDPDGELEKVASAVKSELRTMVLAALDDTTVVQDSNDNPDLTIIKDPASLTTAVTYTESTDALGPKFSASDLSESISYRDPYIVYKYNSGATVFTKTDASNLAKDIIATMNDGSIDGTANGGFLTAEDTLGLEGLSAGSLWRSGREAPLAIPGIFVAEACSPKYAAKATALGNEYITALPCEISVYVDDMDDTNQTIAISFLNPNFMFGTMFEGAIPAALADGTIDKAGAIEYSTLADVVFGDLRMIVDHAVQHNTIDNGVKLQLDIK